jgi:branched-chain amino acid aminotransferase
MPEEIHPRYLWFNGELRPYESAKVHVNALGHATVSGVYEGIRAYWNAQKEELYLIRLREHMERWFDSIKIVRMKPRYSLDQLTEADAILTCSPWPFSVGLEGPSANRNFTVRRKS